MKCLLLLAGLAAFGFASAQDDALHYFQKKTNKPKKFLVHPEYQPTVSFQLKKDIFPASKETAFILPDGNKVALLGQDNMPCIKPDMMQFNMPNAGSPEMLQRWRKAIANPGFKKKVLFTSPLA